MSKPELVLDEGPVKLYRGDCREVMALLPDSSVDSIVTDPPYELGFMGKGWDSSGIAFDPIVWAQAFRVLKPGGHVLAFGGTRTWHRVAVAVEDAGFEIRDSIAWLYGQGFPKSLDVSKAIEKSERGDLVRAKLRHFATTRKIDGRWLEEQGVASAASFADWTVGGHVPSDRNWDIVKTALGVTPEEEAAFEREVLSESVSRVDDGTVYSLGHSGKRVGAAVTDLAKQWEGWGTALKPAFEPVVVARKPLEGTVAANVLAYGTGALNIDACRIGDGGDSGGPRAGEASAERRYAASGAVSFAATPGVRGGSPKGRFPSNVILDESQAVELDRQTGTLSSGMMRAGTQKQGKAAGILGEYKAQPTLNDTHGDSGGGSRFYYVAKAGKDERPVIDGEGHTTVKPLALMRYLVRLVTRPGGKVLEPFAGSGTTLEACVIEGFDVIGAELDEDGKHIPLILKRLAKPHQQTLFGDL